MRTLVLAAAALVVVTLPAKAQSYDRMSLIPSVIYNCKNTLLGDSEFMRLSALVGSPSVRVESICSCQAQVFVSSVSTAVLDRWRQGLFIGADGTQAFNHALHVCKLGDVLNMH